MEKNQQNATLDEAELKNWRNQFPILSRTMNGKPLVFLDSAASSQKPRCVIDAISGYYSRHHANIHRGVYGLSQEATDLFEHARRKVQQFIGAAHEHEIIFTRGTTEAINLVASSFGQAFIGSGDIILLTTMEHHSNIVPWQLLAQRTGAKIEVVGLMPDGSLDLEDFHQKLSARVKIMAITHVSNALGTVNPVGDCIAAAHAMGAAVLVDGAQSIPHMAVDVQALDADFYVFSGHKMYGPTGIGILYGKEKWLNAMPPYHGGGEMIRSVRFEETTYNDLPFKFEAGTPHIAGAIGLGAAIDFMMESGVDAIGAHESELLEYALDQMYEIPDIRFIGEAKQRAGVISFLMGHHHPYDVGMLLDKQGIAVRTGHHCTEPLMHYLGIPGTVRASFGMYNTREDIDALVIALRKAQKMLS
jgi:cysteine desulfurase / selenocysteine lyase